MHLVITSLSVLRLLRLSSFITAALLLAFGTNAANEQSNLNTIENAANTTTTSTAPSTKDNNSTTTTVASAANPVAPPADDEAEVDLDLQPTDSQKLPHPRSISKWRTRELVMANNLPDYEKIKECQTEVTGLANRSLNHVEMLNSRNLLTQQITDNPALYHWCFYVTVNKMDEHLDKADMSLGFNKKYSVFIQDMKELWVLSRALDLALRSKKYFSYLRRRYIELQAQHFGQQLTVIGAPVGDSNYRDTGNSKKPAESSFFDF